jgi:hypothetical protein
MARFRLVADEPRLVSMLPAGELRRLEPDELFEVPDEHAASYEGQPYYQRDEAPKSRIADLGKEV